MKSNELLKLFITYETRGGDNIRREWKELEREGGRVEKNLADLDDSYSDLGKNAEKSGKRQQGALAKTAQAVGSLRSETRDLGSDTARTSKSASGLSDAFGDAADRSVADLKRLQGALRSIGDEEGAVEIGMAIDQASKREAQAEIARFKAGLDDETVNVTIDYDRSQLQQIGQGFREAASGIRTFEVLAGAVAVPGIISAVAGAIPLVVALTGRTAQLGSAFGAGLAGGAVIGGTAIGGMVVGLKAYNAVIGSTIASSREAYFAENQAAQERLENYRNTVLTTRASAAFNRELDEQQMRWYDLQAAVGNAVFPRITEELDSWDEAFGAMEPKIVANAGAITTITTKFAEWLRTAQEGRLLGDVFGFINRSAVGGATILTTLGRTGLRVFQTLIGPADRFRQLIAWGARELEKFVMQAQATGMLADAVGYLERRMSQVGHIVGYLIQAFVNMTRAANAAVDMERILNPIVSGAQAFRDFTAEGNRGASAITNFMNRSEPALGAFNGLVSEAVRQVLILANSLVSAGQSGGRIGTLATVINSVKSSLQPIRVLLQETFIQLAPALARLIPEIVRFASAFLGSSNVLVAFVNRITQLLEFFNDLPGPVKSVVIELVALNGIMGLLGGPTIVGLVGGLVRAVAQWRVYTGVQRLAAAASAQQTAATNTQAVASTRATIAERARTLATKAGAAAQWLLNAAMSANPILLVVAALAAISVALVIAYRRSEAFRKALQPVISLFNQFKNVAVQAGRIISGVFSGDMNRVRQAISSLPAPLQQFGKNLAVVTMAARRFAQQALQWLLQQGQRFISWWQKSWPKLGASTSPVLQKIGQVIRSVLGAALKFALTQFRVVQQWVVRNWPLIQKTATTVFRLVAAVVRTQLGIVLAVVRAVVGAVVAFWRTNSQQIVSIGRSVWNIVRTIISTTLKVILGVVKASMQLLTGNWRGALQTLIQTGKTLLNGLVTVARNLLNILVQAFRIAWNTLKSATSAAWEYLMNTAIGQRVQTGLAKVRGWISSAVGWLKARWSDIESAASSAWTAISGAIWRPIETAYTRVTEFIGKILGAINKVLGMVGLDPIGGGSGAGNAPKSNTQPGGGGTAGAVRDMAKGGRVSATPGGVYRVAEAGQDEWVINPERSDNVPYMRDVAGQAGYDLVPRGSRARGGTGRRPRVPARARRGLFPPWRAGGAASVGPTMHTYIPEMQRFVDDAEAQFPGIYTNTYSNHPPGFEQPYYRERSTDFWGPGGRGAPIGTALGDETTAWTIDRLAGDLNWLIWNGRMLSASGWGPDTSGFDHSGHQHTTAFADGPSASGGGSGGGMFASIFSRAWDRLVQPIVDTFLGPMKDSNYVLTQAAGAAAQKIPDGIKKWALAKLGSTSGGSSAGSGLSGTPAQNRALGEKMFPNSGLAGSFSDVDAIWTQESGWDHTAQNPSSSAFGIPQFLDSTWEQYGGVSKDAEGQIRKGYAYIGDRYHGSASRALAFKQANGWYGRGGMAVGPQLMGLAEEGASELVLPLGDRRVQTQVQSLFQIEQMRDELAGVRRVLEGGIRVDSYGHSAAQAIVDGYHNAPRRYFKSREGRQDVTTHQNRRAELDRVSGRA